MDGSARETTATRGLLSHAAQRFTGRLSVGRGGLEVAVYLLNGDLVAAASPGDLHRVVEVLGLRGLLTPEEVAGFEGALSEPDRDVFGELLDHAGGPVLDGILRDRFIQNLSEFVSSTLDPRAEARRAVFVENIQLGHDTSELVLATCDDYDAAMEVDPDMLLVRGDVDPGRGPARAVLVAKLSAQPRTVRSIIQDAPLEPLRARLVLGELIRLGVADIATEHGDEPALLSSTPARPPASSPRIGPGMTALAEPTESVHLPLDAHVPLQLPSRPRPSRPHPAPPEDSPEAPERTQAVPDPTASPPFAPVAAPPPAPVVHEAVVEEVDDDEDPEDDPTVQVHGAPDDQRHQTAPIDEEDLFAFGDHDRRSRGEGAFSTEDHHRDLVDVAGLDLERQASPAPAPRAGEPTLRFAGPALPDDEVIQKVQVANSVLRVVARAFDESEGSGRGRAVVQLLVEGGSPKYSVVLRDLRVSEAGELPPPMFLLNLRKRPEPEQRPLLHNGLVDIIERALSAAADTLPDDQLDDVLESVAGYRQRLGR